MGREKVYFDPSKVAVECEKKGWSLYKLAQECGYDVCVLSRVAGGHRSPRYDTVAAIAEALGVSMDSFLGDAKK